MGTVPELVGTYVLHEAENDHNVVELSAASRVLQISEAYRTAKVNWKVHPSDGGMSDPGYQPSREHYLNDSRSGMRNIFEAMIATGKTEIRRILDMPSGFGRVLRHLSAAFPNAEITACDIMPEAVGFCADTFGAVPVLSQPELDRVDFGGRTYDLIWSGSFFTHLPAHRFLQALRRFSALLAPGGIAVLTAHGRFSAVYGSGIYLPPDRFNDARATYDAVGFGYSDYEHRYTVNEYGITLSSPSYVTKLLEDDESLSLVSYVERGWSNHQDVIVVQKKPILRPR